MVRVAPWPCRRRGEDGITQVWKAEEGDLNSPQLQSQRASLPQLQKDPLQLQLDMDTLIVEVGANTPLVEVRPELPPTVRRPPDAAAAGISDM